MKKRIAKIMMAVALVLGVSAVALTPVANTYADSDLCTSDVPDAVKIANGCDVSSSSTSSLEDSIVAIMNRIVVFASVIALIVIVIGAVLYMTSNGDPTKVKRGRDTILYAAIGLVVCALAGVIVNFVIARVIQNPGEYSSPSTCRDAGFEWKDGKCQ